MARVSLMALSMVLQSNNGVRLELILLPDETEDTMTNHFPRREHWLNLQIRFRDQHRCWQFSFPCLEEADAAWLIEFLANIRSMQCRPDTHSHFLEPHLQFAFKGHVGHDVLIHLMLCRQSRPPWIKQETLTLRLRMNVRQIAQAEAALRFELLQIRPALILDP